MIRSCGVSRTYTEWAMFTILGFSVGVVEGEVGQPSLRDVTDYCCSIIESSLLASNTRDKSCWRLPSGAPICDARLYPSKGAHHDDGNTNAPLTK